MPPQRRKKKNALLEWIKSRWRAIPIHCSYCCKPNDAPATAHESVGWCSHCHRVFHLPLFKAPNWVSGVLVILVVNLMS